MVFNLGVEVQCALMALYEDLLVYENSTHQLLLDLATIRQNVSARPTTECICIVAGELMDIEANRCECEKRCAAVNILMDFLVADADTNQPCTREPLHLMHNLSRLRATLLSPLALAPHPTKHLSRLLREIGPRRLVDVVRPEVISRLERGLLGRKSGASRSRVEASITTTVEQMQRMASLIDCCAARRTECSPTTQPARQVLSRAAKTRNTAS